MTNEEKIDKVCEMLKEMLKYDAFDEGEIDKFYKQIVVAYNVVKQLSGENDNE